MPDNESMLFYCRMCRTVWGLYFFPNGTEWDTHPGIPSYGKQRRRCPECSGYNGKHMRMSKNKIMELTEEVDENTAD